MDINTQNLPEESRRVLRQADTYVRQNPVPIVLGALGLGIAIGLLSRSQPRTTRDVLRDHYDDTEDYLRSILAPLAKKSGKHYRKAASAVRDAVEDAVEKARDVDVDDYADSVSSFWRRLWK